MEAGSQTPEGKAPRRIPLSSAARVVPPQYRAGYITAMRSYLDADQARQPDSFTRFMRLFDVVFTVITTNREQLASTPDLDKLVYACRYRGNDNAVLPANLQAMSSHDIDTHYPGYPHGKDQAAVEAWCVEYNSAQLQQTEPDEVHMLSEFQDFKNALRQLGQSEAFRKQLQAACLLYLYFAYKEKAVIRAITEGEFNPSMRRPDLLSMRRRIDERRVDFSMLPYQFQFVVRQMGTDPAAGSVHYQVPFFRDDELTDSERAQPAASAGTPRKILSVNYVMLHQLKVSRVPQEDGAPDRLDGNPISRWRWYGFENSAATMADPSLRGTYHLYDKDYDEADMKAFAEACEWHDDAYFKAVPIGLWISGGKASGFNAHSCMAYLARSGQVYLFDRNGDDFIEEADHALGLQRVLSIMDSVGDHGIARYQDKFVRATQPSPAGQYDAVLRYLQGHYALPTPQNPRPVRCKLDTTTADMRVSLAPLYDVPVEGIQCALADGGVLTARTRPYFRWDTGTCNRCGRLVPRNEPNEQCQFCATDQYCPVTNHDGTRCTNKRARGLNCRNHLDVDHLGGDPYREPVRTMQGDGLSWRRVAEESSRGLMLYLNHTRMGGAGGSCYWYTMRHVSCMATETMVDSSKDGAAWYQMISHDYVTFGEMLYGLCTMRDYMLAGAFSADTVGRVNKVVELFHALDGQKKQQQEETDQAFASALLDARGGGGASARKRQRVHLADDFAHRLKF